MFELNLIKDKQKARQRRRIVFLAVSGIVLLSGLTAISVGGLIWKLMIEVDGVRANVVSQTEAADQLEASLSVREPAARERRNGLILAWNEDVRVMKDRPYFTPALADFAGETPATVEFWYNSIAINMPGGGSDDDDAMLALLEGRHVVSQGYIEIDASSSHVMAERELSSIAGRMRRVQDLAGPVRFDVDEQNEIAPGGGGMSSKYMPFTASATQGFFGARE